MSTAIAFYKGAPPTLWRKLGHYAIRLWTWSKWSHAELVIDGVCYSASKLDRGVRSKIINLDSGRWDVVPLAIDDARNTHAKVWFAKHQGERYDNRNIIRFILAFVGHDKNKWVCFEAVGEALGLAASQKLTANDLYNWSIKNGK